MANNSIITPSEILKNFDAVVVGQDVAKRKLSLAVYQHFIRLDAERNPKKYPHTKRGIEFQKSNILMVGPTGTGKTLLAQTASRILDIPMVIVDATTYTESGYAGDDVQNMVQRLYVASGKDRKRTEGGIIFIDEIDKLAKIHGAESSSGRTIGKTGVQQALLKMIEGTVVQFNDPDATKQGAKISIDTKNILFICSGAFVGLKDIVDKVKKKEEGSEKVFGFVSHKKATEEVNPLDQEIEGEILSDHLQTYGLIPEFIGRIPVIINLKQLTEEILVDILTKSKNSPIKQLQAMFVIHGVKLKIKKECYGEIARLALKNKTGARGLKAILDHAFSDILFKLPDQVGLVSEILIPAGFFSGDAEATIIATQIEEDAIEAV